MFPDLSSLKFETYIAIIKGIREVQVQSKFLLLMDECKPASHNNNNYHYYYLNIASGYHCKDIWNETANTIQMVFMFHVSIYM